VARHDAAWVSGLALLLIAGIGGCDVRGMPVAGGTGRTAGPVTVYVANEADDTVTPIQAASNTAGTPIRVGPAPALIAISPDGQTAYVVGIGSIVPGAVTPVTLTAIRTATNTPGRVITVCAPENLGGVIAPDAIAITPDSRTVYVSCPGEVVPVRAGAGTTAKPIRVSSAGALAMAADGRTVYVANPDGDTITPISTATDQPGPPIVVGPSPDAMAVTPDGRTVLVLTSTGATSVTPVDAVTNRLGTPVAIQGAYAVAVAPGSGTAYVLAMPDSDSQQGFVVPVHIRTSTAGTPIKVGRSPVQIAFTPNGKMAYVANYASASVTPIRLADGRAESAIPDGKIATRLAVSPDGTTVYLLDSNIFGGLPCTRPPCASGRVIPIRVATNSAGKPIKVGRWPIAIAIAP
jgi:DNA-binding beta-propeller fold protein YncE